MTDPQRILPELRYHDTQPSYTGSFICDFRELCGLFGVPAACIGSARNENYASAKIIQEHWRRTNST